MAASDMPFCAATSADIGGNIDDEQNGQIISSFSHTIRPQDMQDPFIL